MHSTVGIDASNYVATFNTAFYFMVGVSLVFLIGLTLTMFYFIFKYNRKKNKTATQIEGSIWLEVTWTTIPTLLALLMFYFGWAGWTPMNKVPDNAMVVTSVARMWNFTFEYENGKQSPELVVPVNTPVKINLVSLDVIHSLFIPAFRIKSDMVPGREKMMWFMPEREGEYDLYCAEYCGLQHSYMNANVKVLSKEKYKEWYADTAAIKKVSESAAPGAEGLAIMKMRGCNACHSSDGTKIVGPSYLKLFGEKQIVVRDGKEVTVTADEEYIKKAIMDPNSEIVKGYPKGLMQSYKGTISDADLAKIIEYLKSLNEK
jgi:cytochrome c oxidase subunit II